MGVVGGSGRGRRRSRSLYHEAAAVKPRKLSPCSLVTSIEPSGFNEAAAVKPRKTRSRGRSTAGSLVRFNEAAAVKPRKTLSESSGVGAACSFNEAAAVKPRKTAVLQHSERPTIFGQLASAAVVCVKATWAARASKVHGVKEHLTLHAIFRPRALPRWREPPQRSRVCRPLAPEFHVTMNPKSQIWPSAGGLMWGGLSCRSLFAGDQSAKLRRG